MFEVEATNTMNDGVDGGDAKVMMQIATTLRGASSLEVKAECAEVSVGMI